MTPEENVLFLLGSLADIRTALWTLNAMVGGLIGSVLIHALVTRRK